MSEVNSNISLAPTNSQHQETNLYVSPDSWMLLGFLIATTVMGFFYLWFKSRRRARKERRKLEMSSDVQIILVSMRKGFFPRKSARLITKASRKFGRTRMEPSGVSDQVEAHGSRKYVAGSEDVYGLPCNMNRPGLHRPDIFVIDL